LRKSTLGPSTQVSSIQTVTDLLVKPCLPRVTTIPTRTLRVARTLTLHIPIVRPS
jgi:hypothetical protein